MRELATHQKILVEAQDLIQRFGFFGLSLQDLADRIKIRKPSLYAHYDSKESLGVSVILEYDRQFKKWTDRLQNETPESKLQEFYKLLERYLVEGKVSPNAALSLEGVRLPEVMRNAYLAFLELQVSWLEKTIREGQERKYFLTKQNSRELAELIFQQVIGAELVARVTGDLAWYRRGCQEILRNLQTTTPAESSSPVLNN
jgi:TetR/AcrR family transcriptional repressor of nem operon